MKPRKQSLEEKCAWMRERQEKLNGPQIPTFEEPFTIQQVAPIWGQSEKVTRRYFAKVKGVRIHANPARYDKVLKREIRKYDTITVPPSVLQRELQRITKST